LGPGHRPRALAPSASASHRHDGRCTRGTGQAARGLVREGRSPAREAGAHFSAVAAAAAFAALAARTGAPGAPPEPTRAPDGTPGCARRQRHGPRWHGHPTLRVALFFERFVRARHRFRSFKRSRTRVKR